MGSQVRKIKDSIEGATESAHSEQVWCHKSLLGWRTSPPPPSSSACNGDDSCGTGGA